MTANERLPCNEQEQAGEAGGFGKAWSRDNAFHKLPSRVPAQAVRDFVILLYVHPAYQVAAADSIVSARSTL